MTNQEEFWKLAQEMLAEKDFSRIKELEELNEQHKRINGELRQENKKLKKRIEEPKKIEHIQIGYTDEAITNYKRANFNSNDMEHICRSIGFMMANINKINDKFNEIIDYISKENE